MSSLSDAASVLQCSGLLTMVGASSLETRHAPSLFFLLLERRPMEITSTSVSYPHGCSPSHSKASPLRVLSAARASTRSAPVTTPPPQEIGSLLGHILRDVCFLRYLFLLYSALLSSRADAVLGLLVVFFYFFYLFLASKGFCTCANRFPPDVGIVVTFAEYIKHPCQTGVCRVRVAPQA